MTPSRRISLILPGRADSESESAAATAAASEPEPECQCHGSVAVAREEEEEENVRCARKKTIMVTQYSRWYGVHDSQ